MSNYKIDKDGAIVCYMDTKKHKDDGLTAEYIHGRTIWRTNGLLHRDDGPAIEWGNGYKEWWINGKQYTKEEFVLLQFSRGVVIGE